MCKYLNGHFAIVGSFCVFGRLNTLRLHFHRLYWTDREVPGLHFTGLNDTEKSTMLIDLYPDTAFRDVTVYQVRSCDWVLLRWRIMWEVFFFLIHCHCFHSRDSLVIKHTFNFTFICCPTHSSGLHSSYRWEEWHPLCLHWRWLPGTRSSAWGCWCLPWHHYVWQTLATPSWRYSNFSDRSVRHLSS